MPGYVLIHAGKISEISVNGESIDEYDTDLTNTSFGFRKMLKEDAYVLKVRGDSESLKIVVETGS